MQARIMIQKPYTDTRTGESFRAWRSLRGWRLSLLAALARCLTATKAAVQMRAGYACLGLAALLALVTLSGCAGQQARSAQEPEGLREVAAAAGVETKAAVYCGAPRKDGGACRRRVKKAGDRCFMHKDAK